MEVVTQEVYKSGGKTFLTERECLNYENDLRNGKCASNIRDFLLEEGFMLTKHKGHDVLTKKGNFNRIHKFTIIGIVCVTFERYVDSQEYKPEKEFLHFQLCELEDFKGFFNGMLEFNKEYPR